MREVFRSLLTALEAGRPTVCCQIVKTNSSTSQKAGALMLAFQDGSHVGTLGGGRVEADVLRRAQTLLIERRREIAVFDLARVDDSDSAAVDGGRLTVLIDPISSPAAIEYYRRFAARALAGEGVTQAVLLDGAQSPTPTSYLINAAGEVVGSLGDVVVPASLHQNLKPLLDRPRPYVADGIAYLPNLSRCRLLIVGGGALGKTLAELAAQLDFDIWVYDARADLVVPERFPHVEQRLTGALGPTLRSIEVTSDTYIAIVTRDHQQDEAALRLLVDRGACYVGLIGNDQKIRTVFKNLLKEGIAREALEQVNAPLGIGIGSQTVMEIAVSIAAELIAHRNLGFVAGRRTNSFCVDEA